MPDRLDGEWMRSGPESDHDSHPHHLFVVRLWWESDDQGANDEWRGWVEHTATRERRYFRELETMSAFIRRCLNEDSAQASPELPPSSGDS